MISLVVLLLILLELPVERTFPNDQLISMQVNGPERTAIFGHIIAVELVSLTLEELLR